MRYKTMVPLFTRVPFRIHVLQSGASRFEVFGAESIEIVPVQTTSSWKPSYNVGVNSPGS